MFGHLYDIPIVKTFYYSILIYLMKLSIVWSWRGHDGGWLVAHLSYVYTLYDGKCPGYAEFHIQHAKIKGKRYLGLAAVDGKMVLIVEKDKDSSKKRLSLEHSQR
jgi:hypothetical protein